MAKLTNEQIDKIATGVVQHALENIGIDFVIGYIEDYIEEHFAVSDEEFDDIYESAQAIADDTIQRLLDQDS